jgi:hypothetical protein
VINKYAGGEGAYDACCCQKRKNFPRSHATGLQEMVKLFQALRV